MKLLEGKTAIITGASRGIGRGIALVFAQYGCNVAFTYSKSVEAALTLEAELKTHGITAKCYQSNAASYDQAHQLVEDVLKDFDSLDILINNAGITKDGLFMWMKPEDWNNVINTSLNGFFNVTNHLIQKLLVNKYGRIINLVSVSGLKGTPGQVNYSAAKGGIIAGTKALAQEIAKRNITVNAVAPGFIKTDMTGDLDEKELKKMIPMNRFGEAGEVAHLVSFLASKKSSYITGEVININGGIYS